MAKRAANKELNRDNWDDEEDEEEAGHFKVATDEDLSKRRIIKAKRRVPAGAEQGTGNVFKGFTGFAGLNNNNKATSSSSLFASKSLSGLNPLPTSSSLNITASKPSGLASDSLLKKPMASSSSSNAMSDASESDQHLENVKALNISVSSWIKQHVDSNPYVDLTPIFHDYEKHMKDIDNKFLRAESQQKPPMFAPPSSQSVSTASSLGPGAAVTTFSFGNTQSAATAEKDPPKGQPEVTSTKDDEQNEEDSVPKPVSVVKAEEGAFHSIRCKLFFKRESSWSELGVGMLNLKKLDKKTQLLIRNDTTLGKVLLNVRLLENTPISRSGKNNVMLVCIPNPPLYSKESDGDNSKPATYLIRVKTKEDADKLFELLKSNKMAAA